MSYKTVYETKGLLRAMTINGDDPTPTPIVPPGSNPIENFQDSIILPNGDTVIVDKNLNDNPVIVQVTPKKRVIVKKSLDDFQSFSEGGNGLAYEMLPTGETIKIFENDDGTFGVALVHISNTCFPGKTPIVTDQGVVHIEKINPLYHTIDKQKIVALTQSISLDKFLIRFERHSLGKNYPNGTVIMTPDHKIFYRGVFIKACKFVGLFQNVHKIHYNGQILYNILMKKHYKIKINNIVCETLHPTNHIAQLYNSSFSDETKNKVTMLINEAIINKDYMTYHKIVSRIK